MNRRNRTKQIGGTCRQGERPSEPSGFSEKPVSVEQRLPLTPWGKLGNLRKGRSKTECPAAVWRRGMDWVSFRDPVSAWTHLLWLVLAVPGTWLLWHRSWGDRPKQISLLIFGLGLIACFGGSTLYHSIHASEERVRFFEKLDCTGIYLLIAGTYTPIAFNLLQ